MFKSQINLLATKRFLPLFITQFLGAFNDNVFKNALVILITYIAAAKAGMDAQIMVTIAAGIFILPFFLFSATAGQIADKYEKSHLIRKIKIAEIIIMAMASLGFFYGNVYILMFVLFLMGMQSTFFGPLKYSILPQHLKENELISGNAIVEAGTFVAILVGTIVGGLLILTDYGIEIVSTIVISLALLGWLASVLIPAAPATSKDIKINYNLFSQTWKIISYSAKNRDVFLSILGISWFWFVGAVFIAQFPNFAKVTLGANEEVVTFFLTIFSLGIGIGSLLCNRMLKGEVSAAYVPLGALGMTLFTGDLYFASKLAINSEQLIGFKAFITSWENIRISFDLLMVSVCSGIYIVPLYAIMQLRSKESHRARVVASNNVLNALFMVISAVITVVMFLSGFTVTEVFFSMAIFNALVALYICKLLPDRVIRGFLRTVLKLLYRVEIKGVENFKNVGDRVLIVANHTSMIDALLIAAYLPEQLTFAVNSQQAKRWFIKPLLKLVKAFPMDPTNPMATKSLIEQIKGGNKVVIFPEGRLTVTGAMMKIYEGTGMIADKSKAEILPIKIDGALYTPFSRLKGKVKQRFFPKITLTILPSEKIEIDEEIKGATRRNLAGEKLYDIMSDMMFVSSKYEKTLLSALYDARNLHGGNHKIINDIKRQPLSYDRLINGSAVMSYKLAKYLNEREVAGVLLPNMAAALVTFFALQMRSVTPAMLNFSTGAGNLISACKTAKIKTILTSRMFIENAKLDELIVVLQKEKIRIIYLEDIKEEINIFDKLIGLAVAKIKAVFGYKIKPDDAGVVLFTSGSEGVPKGVVLSHKNIMANIYQLAARVDFSPRDIVFNSLPLFHSFGLTGGALLPVLSGVPMFLYPSPLHYKIVPELIYDVNATIMFGTDTFLSSYARFAHPYDFYSLRYVFAGAEKLKEETRKLYADKFGVRIFEGYGATETAPVLATNTPMHNKPGTVGRLMPMIKYRLEKVEGVAGGGRLIVSGPNIMKGYLLADNPGNIAPPKDGWYDTGDIVDIDEQNYITIKGRAKRFAKIAGEMVSLGAVEDYLKKLWPENNHAVIAVSDAKKGEQLILFTDKQDANKEEIIKHVKENNLAEISITKTIVTVDKLPILATGKVNYVKLKEYTQST